MAEKTLSVIMPNYNDSQYISLALTAICEQSYPPTEVIVVDDASTDNSAEVIQGMIARYPVIHLIHNEENRGVNYSANKAISLTTGDYIFLSSANDLTFPGFFEKAVGLLEQYPQAGLCWSDWLEINSTGEIIKSHSSKFLPNSGYIPGKQLASMFRASAEIFLVQIGGTSSIFRRDLLPNYEAFTPELESFADWILCQTLACRHGICYIPEFLAAIRSLEHSYSQRITSKKDSYQRSCAALFRLLASPEYRDVTPLLIHSRCISKLDPCVRSPIAVVRALQGIKTKEAQALVLHSIEERFRDIVLITMRNFFINPLMYLKNLYDQAFARSFHEYDKVRRAVKNTLKSSFSKSH